METYQYSDDERLSMSPFNDPVFKHIFPFWRHPEIVQNTDPAHIPALLAYFRLGISAFVSSHAYLVRHIDFVQLREIRQIAPSQSFAPIVAAAIRNTALAVKMFPQDAETRLWLADLPEISEHQVT